MKKSEDLQHGLGYAAGREDASGVPTVSPDDRSGFIAFAEAYAAGWEEYNTEARGFMTNARDAYDTWQATGGRSIFRREIPGPVRT